VSVAGIPKTIDNDLDYIDHSFGFSSAVEAAQLAIRSAKVEAVCNLPNGIGIVKCKFPTMSANIVVMVSTCRLTCASLFCLLVMGRSAGYIAAHATMASSDIDLCLIPEVPIVLEGEDGCLPHLLRRVKEQGYAVVVVAEGAGEDVLGISAEVDAGGNRKLPAIGEFMKKQVEDYFVKHGDIATVKYIDPSYTVRSVPANAADSLCKHHNRRHIATSHVQCSWSTIFSRYSLFLADVH
jgi:6-phosphofructokinase 1